MLQAERVRYTLRGPDDVERRIDHDQQRVVEELVSLPEAHRIVAVVLAGGYGRGEGGYRYQGSTAVPYNDYDYFVVVRNCGFRERRRLRRRLHALGERLSGEFGLEVDFALLAAERLGRLPSCLMYSELKWRHRVLVGERDVLDDVASPPVDRLPLAEFSRMMLNRGALLLMNACELHGGAAVRARACERFLRYFSKALLAAGDARLAAAGRYHPSVEERRQRLHRLDWSGDGREQFLELYDFAVRIKLGGEPVRVLRPGEPQRLHRLAVHEWLEAYRVLETARLGSAPETWQSYAAAAVAKGQGAGRWWSPFHHLALAVLSGNTRARWPQYRRAIRHPRERLMAALPLLLEPGAPGQSRIAAEALGASADAAWPQLAGCFLQDWRRYC